MGNAAILLLRGYNGSNAIQNISYFINGNNKKILQRMLKWPSKSSKLAHLAGLSSIGRYGHHWLGRKVGGPI